MRIELPILVESRKVQGEAAAASSALPHAGGSGPGQPESRARLFHIRPLFFNSPAAQDRDLVRAKAKLVGLLAKQLSADGKSGKHRELVRYTFCPDLKLHQLKLRLDLRRQTCDGRFPIAVFEHLGRRLAFSPHLPELWFELQRGQDLAVRTTEVYSEYFKKLERSDGEAELQLALGPFTERHELWLEYVEFNVDTHQDLRSERDRFLALLGPAEQVEGAVELAKVGTCLDHLYPDGLRRFFDGEPQVAELERLIGGKDAAPVMILGPPMVGKTALVHEAVFRRVARRRSPFERKNNVWAIAPQRLVSGMMYVGQWEERLLAILKTARKREHVLYFDDVLGLYHAGITSNSNLSVADVLKPYVERGEVRIVAEMTPEAWRVLRERDRGFADLFRVLPLEEPASDRLLPLVLRLVRQFEAKHGCRFAIDVLPTVLELTRRYQAELANPGKTAVALEQLVRKHSGDITRQHVLEHFQDRTGLDPQLLNRYETLERQEVLEALRQSIIGQQAALEAMADVVMVAKSQLNDPQKPLTSMLFLGPTGVGKTESAKALARYLFGSEDRLLRFDMNEFSSPDSAARLVGTFDRPDGLLASAIRQQPFSVLLLDEIEKAHPTVFDLLLQILGDARLSDALGRTVDFSNVIVILTSNLGTREAASQVGFLGDRHQRHDAYLREVREFFRPELFNRLDRIIPFDSLNREELGRIARKTLADVFGREGFVRRQCTLELLPGAEDWVIERGYDPALGARAMKRAVEDHVVRPLSVEVAALPRDLPMIVSLARRGERLCPEAIALKEAERWPGERVAETIDASERTLRNARAALERMEQEAAEHRPDGELIPGNLRPEQELYFGFKDALTAIRRELDELRESRRRDWDDIAGPAIAPKRPSAVRLCALDYPRRHTRQVLQEMVAADDIHAYLAELTSQPADESVSADAQQLRLRRVCESLAWLEAVRPAPDWRRERVLIVVRGLRHSGRERNALARDLESCQSTLPLDESGDDPDAGIAMLACTLSLSEVTDSAAGWWELLSPGPLQDRLMKELDLTVLGFEGVCSEAILARTAGTYLFADEHGRMHPLQTVVLPVPEDSDYGETLEEHLTDFANGSSEASGLFSWLPVVALYAPGGRGYRRVADFRSGLRATGNGSVNAWAALVATLPPPAELERIG